MPSNHMYRLSRASREHHNSEPNPSQCDPIVGSTINPRHVVLRVPCGVAEWDICCGRHNRYTCYPFWSGGSDRIHDDHYCFHWQHTVVRRAVHQFYLQHYSKWVYIAGQQWILGLCNSENYKLLNFDMARFLSLLKLAFSQFRNFCLKVPYLLICTVVCKWLMLSLWCTVPRATQCKWHVFFAIVLLINLR